MIILVSKILLIIWLHFIADFLLQTQWMATNKSKNCRALLAHCVVYGLPIILISPAFALVNALLHMAVDYFTSRATSWLWKWDHERAFFAMVGFDQAIHSTCLILTGGLVYKGLL